MAFVLYFYLKTFTLNVLATGSIGVRLLFMNLTVTLPGALTHAINATVVGNINAEGTPRLTGSPSVAPRTGIISSVGVPDTVDGKSRDAEPLKAATRVPLVGKVTSVVPDVLRMVAFAPKVVRLPPRVIVLFVFAIPVPPYCPGITAPFQAPLKLFAVNCPLDGTKLSLELAVRWFRFPDVPSTKVG